MIDMFWVFMGNSFVDQSGKQGANNNNNKQNVNTDYTCKVIFFIQYIKTQS